MRTMNILLAILGVLVHSPFFMTESFRDNSNCYAEYRPPFDPNQASPGTKKPVAKPAAKSSGALAPGKTSTITININVVPEMMQFTKTVFTVKAGQKVILDFENGDNMQHNLVIIKPGTAESVGAAADELARDPKGALKNYVPQVPEVLFATRLLDPQSSFTLQFTAPAQNGDYPYLCTFPGHWRMMKGIMKVIK